MVRWKPLPGVTAAYALQTIEPRTDTGSYVGASWLEYRDLRPRLGSFQFLFASRMAPLTIGDASRVERATGLFVSGNYFDDLGLRAAAGRFLTPEEAATPGGEPVVVISYDYWQSRFGGAPSAIGQPLKINGETLVVVGVTPRRFQGTVLGLAFDMWVPATMASTLIKGSRELDDRSVRGYTVMGRLRPGVVAAAAQGELDAAMHDLAIAYPGTNQSLRAEIMPFTNPPRGPQRMIGTALVLLQSLMLLVFVAVCGNTANLLLARASVRQREFGVRLALGAARRRVAGLVLLEALLLSLTGTAIGAALAVWGTQALRAGEISGAFPIRFQTEIDGVGLAFAIGLGLVSTLLAAGVPAWYMARLEPQQALRAGSRRSARSSVRQTLMALQVALALLVLLIAGLFLQRFQERRDVDPGFRADGVMLAAYDLTGRGTNNDANRQFASRVLAGLRNVAGVESAALASSIPLDIHGLPVRTFTLEGRARESADPDQALSNIVTPGYFETMGIPLLAGRDFAAMDDTAAPPQVIVNDAFVRRYLDGAEPLGRRLQTRSDDVHDSWRCPDVALRRVWRAADADRLLLVPRSAVEHGPDPRPHQARRRGDDGGRHPPCRRRSRYLAARLRRADAAGTHREEPRDAPRSGAHVPGARTAAPHPCRDRHLRRRRLHGRAADAGDRTAAGARCTGDAGCRADSGRESLRRDPWRRRRACHRRRSSSCTSCAAERAICR